MLKILINNEEVVCDKQLEIKEEMLSTSSCILNNCYPKSWENTKDYTSQYYYPKDYSKCVIKDEIDIPAEEGEYATGTNLNINVDNTKEWSYQLQGDTQQEGTPTPSNPQDVEVVTGEQNIQIVGKNLIKFPNIAETTVNGITYSIQDDVISLNGTATYNIRYIYASNFAFNGAGDYRITLIPISGNYTRGVLGISSRNEDKTQQIVWQQVDSGAMTNKKTYTAENISQIKNIGFYINSGSVLNNLKFKFMFTKGDNVPTTFEPYQTQNFTIDLGSIELCKIGSSQDYIYENNGDWYLHKETETEILPSSDTTNRVWTKSGVNKNNTYIYTFRDHYLKIGSNLYSNMFLEYTATYLTNNDIYGCAYSTTGDGNPSVRVGMTLNGVTTVANFRTWLSANQPTFYYELATPTDTQITDTSLIQQLNNLKNATLFNGVNNISVEGNLPSILNLHYNFVTARTDTTLLFSGVVKNTGNINLNPRYPHYCNLEVLDFKTFLSECEQLDFVINNKTVSEAIEQVTQAVASYGFVVGNININDDTIIGAYSTQEKTPYDVFQYLADISQSRWYTRLVDENTVAIDFYDPVAMERGIDLDFSDNTFACQNNIEDLSFNYGTYDYRNKQIMLSNQVFGGVDFEETIIADGYNKIFNTTTPIGILKGITVNGSSATFATNEDKEMGVEADFYYNPGQTQIESNENDGTYPANTIIIVGYTPLVKGRQVISDTTEISRIATQTGRNGTISRYEKRNDVLSSDELELIGNSYLKYKGTPEINLTVVTKDIDLYNIGKIVYFNYPNIEDLSKDYMVKSKKTRIINTATDWNIWYTYTLTSNFNSENAINYFDNQRAKSTGNIQVGDYITRNVDIENSCMIIFSNPTATEITIADNNILNAPLNAPFTQ